MFPGAYLLGAQVVTWWLSSVRPVCECYCRGDPSEGVLALLGQQLSRCGPEHLARACPAADEASWRPAVALLCLLFLAGFAAGLATAVVVRHYYPAWAAAVFGAQPPPVGVPLLSLTAASPQAPAPQERRGPLTPAAKRAIAASAAHGSGELPHA